MSEKTVFITGASRGIGSALAFKMAMQGYKVAIGYNTSKDQAEKLKEKILSNKGNAITVNVKVEDRKSVKNAIVQITNDFSDIGILVNNAGISQEKKFLEISDTDLLNMLSINLMGSFISSQEVLPFMVKNNWGRIINIASVGGQIGGINQIHYAMAKSGLLGLTKSLARLYAKNSITVNAVSPGLVATDMTANEINSNEGKLKIQQIPIGRIAEMDEIIPAVIFLSKDSSSYITGQCINVNGGMYFG
jgi:acetoacetyl-CoA reductase/3-oxoacyl-[acyl-carrier protein] reductase